MDVEDVWVVQLWYLGPICEMVAGFQFVGLWSGECILAALRWSPTDLVSDRMASDSGRPHWAIPHCFAWSSGGQHWSGMAYRIPRSQPDELGNAGQCEQSKAF